MQIVSSSNEGNIGNKKKLYKSLWLIIYDIIIFFFWIKVHLWNKINVVRIVWIFHATIREPICIKYSSYIGTWTAKKGDFLIARKHALTIEEVVKGIKMRHYNIELFLCMGRCDYIICQTGFPFFISMKEKAAIYEIWSQQHIGILISGTLCSHMDENKSAFIHYLWYYVKLSNWALKSNWTQKILH